MLHLAPKWLFPNLYHVYHLSLVAMTDLGPGSGTANPGSGTANPGSGSGSPSAEADLAAEIRAAIRRAVPTTDAGPVLSFSVDSLTPFNPQDPENWFEHNLQCLELYAVPQDKWARFLGHRLSGTASAWWTALYKEHYPSDIPFQEFRTKFFETFVTPENTHLRRIKLLRVYQGNRSITKHIDAFNKAAMALSDDNPYWLFTAFLSGLNEDELVTALKEDTLAAAQTRLRTKAIARLRTAALATPSGQSSKKSGSTQRAAAAAPAQMPAALVNAAAADQRIKTRLTPAERAELRAKGLCFYCRDPDHPHHMDACPNKPAKGPADESENGRRQ